MVEPIIEEAPSTLQNDLTDLIVALYRASTSETIFLLKHILKNTQNEMTAVTLRRISSDFPPPLEKELRDLLRPQPKTPKPVEMDNLMDKIFATEPIESTEPPKKKPRKPYTRKTKSDDATPQKKTSPLKPIKDLTAENTESTEN
jgi:hypothetical protein